MLNKLLSVLAIVLMVSACGKMPRIDHEDDKYIYVWEYNDNDSTLVKYKQPAIVEHKVMGGHHKNHHIYVDYNDNGVYTCCRLPYDGSVDRCKTVEAAQEAACKNEPIIGVFKERYYPHHELYFIRYKND